MNFIKIIRNLFGLGLFIAFIVTTIQALISLTEKKIGTSVRTEEREEIILPSWTLCPFDSNPVNYEKNASNLYEFNTQIPLNFTIIYDWGIVFNMTDKKTLEDKFNVTMEETWHVHCKANFQGSGCNTCWTFNAPLKTVPKFFAMLAIQDIGKEAMILQLHNRGNSLALNWEYNWSQLSYFVFKKGKT